ncbi:RNA polymerase sigma factor [Promicromonospora sp. NPDC019610]|uniref:RNA polymerase sigma factor n=1 Tax=Promicromonospora sp. NPDC019610 TaxID=3364405 RepID=UPI0037AB5695
MTIDDAPVDDWVVHRPNVVRSVAARVPGIDAEEATSRALEKMVRLVSTGATIDDPAPYWRRAAVNEAISMTREAGRARPVEDDTLDGLTPTVAGAELDAEREADASMLRTALSDLADEDRKILLDRHVHDMAVTDIATGLGVRPHAVTMRLRRAEERLAGAFAAAHAQTVNEPECRTTRAAMHDYLKGRLLPRRQRRLEVHMDGCGECTRAFIDVREVSWMLRDLGQHLITGGLLTGSAGAGIAGVAGAAGPTRATRLRSFGTKHAAVAAAVAAALAIGAGAMALIAVQPDSPSIQADGEPFDGGGAEAPLESDPTQDPSTPADPPRRPAAPAEEHTDAEPAAAPDPVAAAVPASTVTAETPRESVDAPAPPRAVPGPVPGTPEPKDPDPAEPAPPAAKPRPEPKPEPEPEPETPPAPGPPDKGPGGPPGNPSNDRGKGPAKDNNQGPGKGNGHGHGHGHDKGHGNDRGSGNGHGKGPGNGGGPGNGNDKSHGSDHGKSPSRDKGHGHHNGRGR